MLAHTVILGPVAQGHIMAPGPQGYNGSSAQATRVRSNNHVVGEHCGSKVAARALGVLSSISRFNG